MFTFLALICFCTLDPAEALSLKAASTRRDAIATAATSIAGAASSLPASAAVMGSGLAAKLSARDPSVLKNSVFNIPPSAQVHPSFMRGEWNVNVAFAGFLFPSKTIAKNKVLADVVIPGFQKCSIAAFADVGRERTEYRMRVNDRGLEDRSFTVAEQIDAHLGYKAVKSVSYDGSTNPNRLTVAFEPYRTRNAERIELFCNARESEVVPNPSEEGLKIFVCSEYIRQVTFSFSTEAGVARQVVGNYAHFWTWREQESGNKLTGNVLTASYLDPQDPMFFEEPSKPVVVYRHQLSAQKVM